MTAHDRWLALAAGFEEADYASARFVRRARRRTVVDFELVRETVDVDSAPTPRHRTGVTGRPFGGRRT